MVLQAQHLVQTGAQVSARDKKGCTTLHFAAAHGQIDIVTYLWSKGAELDWESPGECQVTSLQSAVLRERAFEHSHACLLSHTVLHQLKVVTVGCCCPCPPRLMIVCCSSFLLIADGSCCMCICKVMKCKYML